MGTTQYSYRVVGRGSYEICFLLNPFTTGNPFLGTKLLGFSVGRGSGVLKGLREGYWIYIGMTYVHLRCIVGIEINISSRVLPHL